VTFDLGGQLGDELGVMFEPTDRQSNARYDQSFAMLAGAKPARGFLIVDNQSAPNQPFEGSLAGEMMLFDFAQGAAWGYAAYNAAPQTELEPTNPADTLYPFEDAAEQVGEVLAGRRDLTVAALNGGASPALPVAIMPRADTSAHGIGTRFFVTPIGHAVTFPAAAVANSTVVNGQAVVGPRHQHRGDLTTEVLLTAPRGNAVVYDRDERPLSGVTPRQVTCVGFIAVDTLLGEVILQRMGESGGWSGLAVRSPGPLVALSGDSNRPMATRTTNTNQATVMKLDFNPVGMFFGQSVNNAFNNGVWLRSGIRESVPRVTAPESGDWPWLMIRSVPDNRQQWIQVGEDFVGDRLQLAPR